MEYNIAYREKNGGIQVIISYKDEFGKWKQKCRQGFTNDRIGKKNAKTAADEMLQTLKNNANLNTENEFKNITFKSFVNIHMNHIKLNSSANTLTGYNTALKHCESFSYMELDKIKSIHVQKCVDDMVVKNLQTSTIKTHLQKLNAIFRAAIEQYNLITTNPVKNIKFKTDKNITTKKVLTPQEEKELLSNITNKQYYIISIIAVKCGLRLGEILGLTWNDIDFNNRNITINKQWKLLNDKIHGFGTVKSKNSNRIVPMPKSVSDYLKEFKNNNPIQIDGRILIYKNTISAGSNLHREFVRLGFDISVHELRHTYATNLISNGVDFKTAAKILGHDIEMTMAIYSHVTDDMIKRATNIIDNCI